MRAAVITLTVTAVLAAAVADNAGAAPAGNPQESNAKALYEEGAELYGKGWFCEAFRKFSESHGAFAKKQTLWNMAMCKLRMGRRDEALQLLELYLIDAGRMREAPVMAAALRQLRESPADIPHCDIRALVDTLLAADREAEAWAQQHPEEEVAAQPGGEEARPAESGTPGRAYELFAEANALEAAGDYDAAARLLEQACQLETDQNFLASLVRVQIHAGRRDAAVSALARCLDALGDDDPKRQALLTFHEALGAEDEPIPEEHRAELVESFSAAYVP